MEGFDEIRLNTIELVKIEDRMKLFLPKEKENYEIHQGQYVRLKNDKKYSGKVARVIEVLENNYLEIELYSPNDPDLDGNQDSNLSLIRKKVHAKNVNTKEFNLTVEELK